MSNGTTQNSETNIGVIPVLAILTVVFYAVRLYGGTPSPWTASVVLLIISVMSFGGSGYGAARTIVRGVIAFVLFAIITHIANWLSLLSETYLFS